LKQFGKTRLTDFISSTETAGALRSLKERIAQRTIHKHGFDNIPVQV
jgi:hypothetical protein